MRTPSAGAGRGRMGALALGAATLVLLLTDRSTPSTFVSSAQGRRALLASSLLGAVVVAVPAESQAADFPGLPKFVGPFEMDPKNAVIVGDPKAQAAQDARAKVVALQDEAKAALAKLKGDPQADLSGLMKADGIADLRLATNTINNLMDDRSAAATQRLQRLMIQAKFQLEDDVPMPTTRKGVVKPRGDQRLKRLIACLETYIENSDQLLKFV